MIFSTKSDETKGEKAMKLAAKEDTLIDYEALYACSLQGNGLGAAAVCLLLLFYYFILMGVVADGYLVPVLIQIGRSLKWLEEKRARKGPCDLDMMTGSCRYIA